MTVRIVHKNSSESGKNPTGSQLANGELAVNYNADGPFLSVKDTNGRVVRVGGVWINGSAPANPAHGSLWVDIDNNNLYLWDADAGAWRPLSGTGGGGGGGGGDVNRVTGGNGITAAPNTGNVIVSADIDEDRGLRFEGANIAVNIGTGLRFNGGTGAIEVTGQALNFVGPVDVTQSNTRPASAEVGDVFVNTGDGNVNDDWADRLSNATNATDSDPGDLVICTARASSQGTGTYVLVQTGGPIDVDLGFQQVTANNPRDGGEVTNTAGDNAVIPFAEHNAAGLFEEPNNADNSTTKNYVRRSVRAADGTQTHSWQETTGAGTVTSISPGNGLQNADGTQNPITGAGELDIDLANSSGLEFVAGDNNSLRVDAHNGIQVDDDGVSVDIAANGGLGFNGDGELQVVAPPADGSFGYWTRDDTDNRLTPREANDVVMVAGGTAALPTLAHTGDPDTGIAFAANDQVNVTARGQEKLRVTGTAADTGEVIVNPGNINCDFRVESDTAANDDVLFVDVSADRVGIGEGTPEEMLHVNGDARVDGHINLDTAGEQLIFTGTDNNPTERTISFQAPTNNAGFGAPYTVTLPPDVPQANEVLQVTAVAGNPAVATTAWNPVGGLWSRAQVGADFYLSPTTNTDRVSVTDGTAALPSITNIGDVDTGIAFAAADQLNLTARGQEKLRVTGTAADTGEVIVNPGNINCDFKVESDTEANPDVLVVDTSADNVGIGVNVPTTKLHVNGNIQSTSQNSGPLAGFRNQIMNGDGAIFQRGTSVVAANDSDYTLDRWAAGGGMTIASLTGVGALCPGFDNGIALTATVGRGWIRQGIELGSTGFAGKFTGQWTISVWATQQPSVALSFADDIAFANASQVLANTAMTATGAADRVSGNSNNTYKQYSHSFPINVAPNAANVCLAVQLSFPVNSQTLCTAIQLEPGPVLTPFEQRPIATELAMCQRYFQVMDGNFVGYMTSSAVGGTDSLVRSCIYPWHVKMRPSGSYTLQADATVNWATINTNQTNDNAIIVTGTVSSAGATSPVYIQNPSMSVEF